ncbi:MAG: DUF4385 domain-containing protein [Pyrinomonadaceae bacterium]
MAAKFDYSLDYKNLNLRRHPELYRVGKGEQGVLMVEPYRTEIVGFWRFRTPEIARESSAKIYEMFLEYKRQKDFVGMDMTRKFLQMGWTRSLRYFNHRSGKKYIGPVPKDKKGQSGAWGRKKAPPDRNYEKLECAKIFKEKLDMVKSDPEYILAVEEHRTKYEYPTTID